ncbi:MAG: FmdB family zinc ribbon protein [Candidatus Limnocylindrales bacterium]|jgi:putative FmdB family regulatory protein
MPLYEYDCLACGERFEISGSIAQGPGDARCPDCDSGDVRRHYGSLAVIHRGRRTPAPGELRPVDPGRLTANVARREAASTGDKAMTEVARRVDAGAGPAELREFVREVKADRKVRDGKRRSQK